MIDFTFENSLAIILEKLNKKEWTTPLTALAANFKFIPDSEYSFTIDLINMLHAVRSSQQIDNSLPVAQLVAIRLATMDCWTFRFGQIGDDGHYEYHNPLYERIGISSHSPVQVTQSSSAFPATDMIKRWAREHLR